MLVDKSSILSLINTNSSISVLETPPGKVFPDLRSAGRVWYRNLACYY